MQLGRLTREESQALTRAKLLACAPEVVAREGYEGASIDKIAEAAGFSKGAFYSNFATKEEFFFELLSRHAKQDVVEIKRLLRNVTQPSEIIDRICAWAEQRASDPTWGLLALELFRRVRREATFGTLPSTLFLEQWREVGKMLLPIASNLQPAKPEVLGAIVLELTYGAASGFSEGDAPRVRDLVRLALTSIHTAHGSTSNPNSLA
jgi:AcrR family transcriptional regulator